MDNSFKFNPYEALKSILEITSYHTGDEFIEHTAIEIKKEINLNDFTNLQQTILKTLQNEPLHIDELALQTQLSMSVLNAELMMLELNGIVVGLPGKVFKVKD